VGNLKQFHIFQLNPSISVREFSWLIYLCGGFWGGYVMNVILWWR